MCRRLVLSELGTLSTPVRFSYLKDVRPEELSPTDPCWSGHRRRSGNAARFRYLSLCIRMIASLFSESGFDAQKVICPSISGVSKAGAELYFEKATLTSSFI